MINEWAPGLWLGQSRFEQMNAGAFVCRGRACLIDPGVYPDEIAAWQRLADRQGWTLCALVLTHHHWDHILGPERFPGVPVVAHAAFLDAVGGPEGAPAVERQAAQEGWTRATPFLAPQPDVTFEQTHALMVGGLRLELLHVPGHAPDQVAVYDRARATLWAADMLSDREIPLVSHNLAAYRRTLARLAALDLRRLIPGHGQPTADPREIQARLDADRAYLDELRARVERAVEKGQSLRETVEYCAAMPYRCREAMAALHRLNVESVYVELGGDADPARSGGARLDPSQGGGYGNPTYERLYRAGLTAPPSSARMIVTDLDPTSRQAMTTDAPSKRAPWWALDVQTVLVIALVIALFTLAARETADPDLWWHLATGRAILQTGHIPRQDVFSYTVPDHPWITHEWLSEVIMVGVYNAGEAVGDGLAALLLATSALIAAAFGLVYLRCEARPRGAVFGVLLGALASAVTWGPRPQMWTMAGLALWGLLLDRWRAGRRWALWLLPLTTALWVNLHSGFLLGPAYLGIVLAGEWAERLLGRETPETLSLRQIRDLALALGACLLAALLNPNGVKILTYPFETLGSGAMQEYIQEWASPDFHQPAYWPLALLLLGGTALLALSRRKPSLTDVGVFCGFGLAALHAARHVPLFAVVAVPILTRYLASPPSIPPAHRGEQEGRPPSIPPVQTTRGKQEGRTPSIPPVQTTRGKQEGRPPSIPPVQTTGEKRARALSRGLDGGGLGRGPWIALNWLLVLLLVLGGAARVAVAVAQNRDVEARRYPVAALVYLEEHGLDDARIYNSYNWGGYLAWRGIPVYIDGRADVYGNAFMDQYVRAFQVRSDWRRPLDDYDVEVVLIERDGSLAALLRESDEWQPVYQDELAVVFTRSQQ